jgi:hypothetical protein
MLASLFAFAGAIECVGAPVIEQSHIITQSVGGLNTHANYTPAQTFTVGAAGKLSMIEVQIGRDAGALDDLALEIWPTAAGVPSGAPLFSTPIYAGAIPVASPSASLPYTPINVTAANLNVQPGEIYAIAVRGTAGSNEPDAFWNWGFPGYSGGNPYDTFSGQPWDEVSSTFDFGFRTWIDPESSITKTLTFVPEFDAAAQFISGMGFAISDGSNSMRVRRNSSGADERAVMEYDLSAIPASAAIESVSFTFDINTRTEGPGAEYPIVRLYGYSADGQMQPSDATQLTRVLGTSPQINSSNRITLPLDGASVADLKFLSNHLGIVAYQDIPPHYVDIVTSELAATSPFFTAPTLSVTFSVPPLPDRRPGDYNGNGIEDTADYTIWRNTFGQTGPNLPADGNGDQEVDEEDYAIWKSAYGNRPKPGIRNGDFATGTLDQWQTVVDPNTNVSVGFPRVESFDVDGDGNADNAMRIRLARVNAGLNEGGRAGIDQEILLQSSGDYQLTVDFASASFQDFGNTAPGRFELYVDDTLVDFADLNGTTINAFEVIRGNLEVLLYGFEEGYHKLGLRVHRPGTNTREIYQYFDNILLTPLASANAAGVPEPATWLVSLLGMGAMGGRRARRMIAARSLLR